MSSYYAKNIVWSGLTADNTLEATFDIYDDKDVEIAKAVVAKGSPSTIQQDIANALKAKAEALDLYNALTGITELEISMTS